MSPFDLSPFRQTLGCTHWFIEQQYEEEMQSSLLKHSGITIGITGGSELDGVD